MGVAFMFLLTLMLSSQVESNTSFKADIDSEGHPSCSLDPPSKCVSLTQPCPPYPIPLCVLCGWECKKTPNCIGFNLKGDTMMCELYVYQPATFETSYDCSYYSVCSTTSYLCHVDSEVRQICQPTHTRTR